MSPPDPASAIGGSLGQSRQVGRRGPSLEPGSPAVSTWCLWVDTTHGCGRYLSDRSMGLLRTYRGRVGPGGDQ